MKKLLIITLLLSGFQDSFGSQHVKDFAPDLAFKVNRSFENACDESDKDFLCESLSYSIEDQKKLPLLTEIAIPDAIIGRRVVLSNRESELDFVDAETYVPMMNRCRTIIGKARRHEESRDISKGLRHCSKAMAETNHQLNPTWKNYALSCGVDGKVIKRSIFAGSLLTIGVALDVGGMALFIEKNVTVFVPVCFYMISQGCGLGALVLITKIPEVDETPFDEIKSEVEERSYLV